MDKTPLYHNIAESIRKEILSGSLHPGDILPSMRDIAARWECTVGTVQQAYKELTGQGLIESRAGQGTRVLSAPFSVGQNAMKRASLVHQAEAFLLQALTAGHSASAVEQAMSIALDRWRSLNQEPLQPPDRVLRFVGSHDPTISLIASRFGGVHSLSPGWMLRVSFAGSIGGLLALAEENAEIAGCHLWDEDTDSYNTTFVRRLLPGRRVFLLTLAHQRLGLIVTPEQATRVTGLASMVENRLRFINRRQGAGTRIWLDAQCREQGIDPTHITYVARGGVDAVGCGSGCGRGQRRCGSGG